MEDRRVHAKLRDGAEIVRYDRAGKWYYESSEYRRQLRINEVIQFVTERDEWIPGILGGSTFDRRIKAARGWHE